MAARVVRREGWSVAAADPAAVARRGPETAAATALEASPGPSRQRERLTAERPNHVWAIDFQFDETADQRRLKLANIVDEYTREALAMRVGRCCTADDLIVELDRLVDIHGAPSSLRCDNGPELIAWALRDWCRLARVGISYIEPGSPWENPYVESFNSRVRDELLNIEDFASLLEAQVVVESVADRVQHLPTPRRAPRAHTRRGPRHMDHRTPTSTLMNALTTKRGKL